ncbi:MAG: hypothetical protein II007_12295 [Gammaproteobacteria bacterium]|nr:hypothetical protein [Gammaproteobacteria bacterium]
MVDSRRFKLGTALLLVLAAAPQALGEEQVYFWHDSQGVIHFSKQRPHEGKIHAVHLPSPKAETAVPDSPKTEIATTASPTTYEALFASAEADKKAAAEKKAAAAKQAQAKKLCEQARQRQEILSSRPRVQRINEDGSRTDMTFEEKQAEGAKLEHQLNTHCSP